MEWTLPETVTVGGIIIGVLFLLREIVKLLAQRTERPDSAVMKALEQNNTIVIKALEGFDELRTTISAMRTTSERQAEALTTLATGMTTSFQALLNRVETGESAQVKQSLELIDVFRSFTVSVREDHARHYEELVQIKPSIAELAKVQTAKLEQSEGLKQIMSATIDEQHRTNGEVMAALRRIQETLDELKREFPERIEKIEQDVNALRVDVLAEKAKSKAHADLSPLTPTPPTEPEPPTETETKDKAND